MDSDVRAATERVREYRRRVRAGEDWADATVAVYGPCDGRRHSPTADERAVIDAYLALDPAVRELVAAAEPISASDGRFKFGPWTTYDELDDGWCVGREYVNELGEQDISWLCSHMDRERACSLAALLNLLAPFREDKT